MERKERKELSSSNSQNMPTLKASYAIDDTAPAMTLKTIAENYSKWFPLVVRVREGCFESEEEEVPTDDVYVLHSVKPIKAILLQAGFYSNCDTKLIPVTADIEVGLMPKVTHFPPIHGQGTARILPTVNDVMALVPHLPMVLCATKNYDSGRPSSSVRASEVIVIKKVTRSVKSFGRRVLKVHSVLEGREKTLKHNCAGFFSTDPLKTRLKLSYLLAHAKVSFPARAHVFYAPGDATTLPPHFYHNPVTLMALVESQSILATSYVDSDELGKCPSRHFELPVYLPISVSLYRHEQKYTYNHGCEAQKPNVYIPRAIHRDDSNDNWNWDENSDTTVDWISLEHLADLEDQPFMPSATESRKGMPSDGSSFSGHTEVGRKGRTLYSQEEERSKLKTLSVLQVCNMLGKLGLQEYRQIFLKEKISGDILAECTEEVLELELDVHSPNHRHILLNLIAGKMSIKNLLA